VDTDILARALVEPGQPALTAIVDAFGPDLLDDAGHLRRAEMARLVFSDPEARRRLEGILHPRIRDLWRRRVDDWRVEGRLAAVVVIPLLFETQAGGDFDAVLCTACTRSSQGERFTARGWTPQEAEARLRAQWPLDQKIARADVVVWTEGDLVVTRQQVDRIARQLNLHSSSPSVRICAEKMVP